MASAATHAWLAISAFALSLAAASPADKTLDAGTAVPTYHLKLARYALPPAGQIGLLVTARINGGPPLRLLLDSGAQFVGLDRKAALKSKCLGGVDLDLVEPGNPPAAARKVLAATIELAGLTLHNVPTVIAGRLLAEGIDGVIPLSLFSGYLIRLDIPAQTLDLLPYPEAQSGAAGTIHALASNDLLFLKGVFNETHEGYFLLDTGASYNAISQSLNRQAHRSTLFAAAADVQAGTAAVDADLFPDAARLRFGARVLSAQPLIAIDLSTISRYHKLEVSGLIGYPALRNSVLTVNYRDGLVSF
jgi:hypothetical protein